VCQVRLRAVWRLLTRFCAPTVLVFPGVLNAQDATPSDRIPINHFIYIIQQNHSFDNYFGTYPGADGLKPGTKLAERPGGPRIYKPFHLSGNAIPQDLDHTWQAARTA
jgi:phospholipase C